MQPQSLRVELQDCHRAEQVGTEQQARWFPGGENDQRDGDPAASGAHVLHPQRGIDGRKISAGNASHGSAKSNRTDTDGDDRIADGMGGLGRFADRLE